MARNRQRGEELHSDEPIVESSLIPGNLTHFFLWKCYNYCLHRKYEIWPFLKSQLCSALLPFPQNGDLFYLEQFSS